MDEFGAENDFHGGEFGLDTLIRRGCWDFNILTKVALGNMHQTAVIEWSDHHHDPTVTPLVYQRWPVGTADEHRLVSWDDFAMIPELDLNLRYHYSERLSFAMGYSLLWVTDVARTGGQIDTVVNTTQLPANGGNLVGPARPPPLNGHTDMWMQGLNLGVVFEY